LLWRGVACFGNTESSKGTLTKRVRRAALRGSLGFISLRARDLYGTRNRRKKNEESKIKEGLPFLASSRRLEMSKTYRRACMADLPWGGTKWAKRRASKAVRRYKGEIPKGYRFLKKLFQSANIHDWKRVYFERRKILQEIYEFEEVKRIVYRYRGWINVFRKDPQIMKERLISRKSIRRIAVKDVDIEND
jgi:hypothetical protein